MASPSPRHLRTAPAMRFRKRGSAGRDGDAARLLLRPVPRSCEELDARVRRLAATSSSLDAIVNINDAPMLSTPLTISLDPQCAIFRLQVKSTPRDWKSGKQRERTKPQGLTPAAGFSCYKIGFTAFSHFQPAWHLLTVAVSTQGRDKTRARTTRAQSRSKKQRASGSATVYCQPSTNISCCPFPSGLMCHNAL